MKQWSQPKLTVLGINRTMYEGVTNYDYDSSTGHACHNEGGENCSDLTNGSHNSMGRPHSAPNWNDAHGHTCCCPESLVS